MDEVRRLFAKGAARADSDMGIPSNRKGLDQWSDQGVGPIARRYGGHNWGAKTTVCNPVDILGVLRHGTQAPHWRDWMRKTALGRFVEGLGGGEAAGDRLYSQWDLMALNVDEIDQMAFRFQTGYEKIREVRRIGGRRLYGVGECLGFRPSCALGAPSAQDGHSGRTMLGTPLLQGKPLPIPVSAV